MRVVWGAATTLEQRVYAIAVMLGVEYTIPDAKPESRLGNIWKAISRR